MTTKGVILEQADRSVTRIEPHGGGANAAIKAETAAEKTFWQKSSPWVHGVLGAASFVPGLSVITGAIDAAIYAAEGDYVEAGIAAASKRAIDNGRGNQKMNVKLEPCRGKGMR